LRSLVWFVALVSAIALIVMAALRIA